jgi:tetratricopeptide (TPR) repeat protein
MPTQAIADLEKRGEWGEAAAALLLHEDPGQAELRLNNLTGSAGRDGRDSDLAAVAFAQGRLAEALELLDAVLERRPDHPQALWNRGVVLAHLEPELPLLAAESFERVARLGETGWSEAARARAQELRERSRARQAAWTKARDAMQAFMSDPRTPLPVEVIAPFPGKARESFYEALRSAQDRQGALALLPLAEALDHDSGGTILHGRVLAVAGADFARRGALARQYAQLLEGKHLDPARLVGELRKSGERDLLLGALLHAPAVERQVAEQEALARELGDPWLSLDAEIDLARLDLEKGRYLSGAERLDHALEQCTKRQLPYQCLRIHRELSSGAIETNQVEVAEARAREQAGGAHRLGEWEQETAGLKALAQALRFQARPVLARAVLGEILARAPRDGKTCSYVHRNLAVLFLRNLRHDGARKEMDLALGCGQPIYLVGASVLAELARVHPGPSDAADIDRALKDEGLRDKSPGRNNLALAHLGRFKLISDPAGGQGLLWKAIADSEPLMGTDTASRDAWSQSFQDLALDAARRLEAPAALELMARRLQVAVPERCALMVVVDGERTAVVTRGVDGGTKGSYDVSRRSPLVGSLEGLVGPEALARLDGCARVDVLTTSPLDTRSGLLPPRMAWTYRGGAALVHGPPAPPLHVVIADVEAPASLHLIRLRPWSAPPGETPKRLVGHEATPENVLAAMAGATAIDIHAHGIVDRRLSGATAIALAPGKGGGYALTAEMIRTRARLKGAPVVSLAACGAAWRPAFAHETDSLPQAFITAGARAVLAATVDVPDSGGAFFSRVSGRIQAGEEPAVALRDERERWLRERPDKIWVKDVLLYE